MKDQITRLSAYLTMLFSSVADDLARETQFVKRERSYSGAKFVRTLVFGWLADKKARIEDFARGGAKFYPYICRTSARKSSLQPAISLFPLRLSLIGCCLRRLIATLLSQERLFAKVRSRTRLASSPNSTSNCQ